MVTFGISVDHNQGLVIADWQARLLASSESPARTASLAKAARLAKLYIPLESTLTLRGVSIRGEVIRDPHLMARSLGEAWELTFAEKAFEETNAKKNLENNHYHLLQELAPIGPINPPGYWDFRQALKTSHDLSLIHISEPTRPY